MRVLAFFIAVGVIVLTQSCKNRSTENKTLTDDLAGTEAAIPNQTAVKKVFFNLPSPIELTQTILSVKSPYNPDLLNPVENIDSYSSSSKLALNFGVYGADLCYSRVYDQLQESISYLAAVRKITDKLQIPEEEGSETINRIEESMNNRDSIFQIISDTYAGADGYLKENERDLTATFILIGAWVEGMHFAVTINNDPAVKNQLNFKIAEQKYSLQHLILLLNQYAENSTVSELLPYFTDLDKIFSQITITYEAQKVSTNQNTQVTTIDNNAHIEITQQQLNDITNLVGKIRNKIIS